MSVDAALPVDTGGSSSVAPAAATASSVAAPTYTEEAPILPKPIGAPDHLGPGLDNSGSRTIEGLIVSPRPVAPPERSGIMSVNAMEGRLHTPMDADDMIMDPISEREACMGGMHAWAA